MAIQLQPWLRVFFLSFSDGQWGLSGFSTPATQTSIFFKLILSFLQKKKTESTLPVVCLVLCGPSTVPFLSPLWRVSPVPLAPAPLPGSLQECAGACNRLCGSHWVVRLTETSQPHIALAAEWGSAWGCSPNHGRCQIPTVALHNRSHTGPDVPLGCGGVRVWGWGGWWVYVFRQRDGKSAEARGTLF